MYQKLVRILFVACFFVPAVAAAVTTDDFLVRTTENLLNLCSVVRQDPQHREAIHMCHGYLIGALSALSTITRRQFLSDASVWFACPRKGQPRRATRLSRCSSNGR